MISEPTTIVADRLMKTDASCVGQETNAVNSVIGDENQSRTEAAGQTRQ